MSGAGEESPQDPSPRRLIIVQPQAEADLRESFGYLAESSLGAASRFLEATAETFRRLVEMPGMGKRRLFRSPRLADVRQWPVTGFPKHLVFYRPVEGGIEVGGASATSEVLRVLHGARDIDSLLEEDAPEDDAP